MSGRLVPWPSGVAVQHHVGEALALPALVAEQQVVLLGPAVVEVGVAVPREADAAVDLDALAASRRWPPRPTYALAIAAASARTGSSTSDAQAA